jgi:hypothetical protein
MNNFNIQRRSAATATIAAFVLAGQGVQENYTKAADSHRPVIRRLHVDGSVGSFATMRVEDYQLASQQFSDAVSVAYVDLAESQSSLAPDMARSLMEGAWDLYDEA